MFKALFKSNDLKDESEIVIPCIHFSISLILPAWAQSLHYKSPTCNLCIQVCTSVLSFLVERVFDGMDRHTTSVNISCDGTDKENFLNQKEENWGEKLFAITTILQSSMRGWEKKIWGFFFLFLAQNATLTISFM